MKEIARKQRTVTIYQIMNRVTNKCYVGSSSNSPLSRWTDHIKRLRGGYHNLKFQAAWNEYGPTAWDFRILEENIPVAQQYDKEQEWFSKFDCEYNGTDKIFKMHKRDDKIKQVLEMLREDLTYREISQRTGMSLGYISKVKANYELTQ